MVWLKQAVAKKWHIALDRQTSGQEEDGQASRQAPPQWYERRHLANLDFGCWVRMTLAPLISQSEERLRAFQIHHGPVWLWQDHDPPNAGGA